MLLMLKVATFSGSLSVLSAASYPPLHKTQGRGTHYVGDVGGSKARATRPNRHQVREKVEVIRGERYLSLNTSTNCIRPFK